LLPLANNIDSTTGLLSGLLPNVRTDVVYTRSKGTDGVTDWKIGLFRHSANAADLKSARAHWLGKVDLVTTATAGSDGQYPFGALVHVSALQIVAEQAKQAQKKDPHFAIETIDAEPQPPATVKLDMTAKGTQIPCVYSARPDIALHFSIASGQLAVDGKPHLNSKALASCNSFSGDKISQGLDAAIGGIKNKVSALPQQILLPGVPGVKLGILDQAVSASPEQRAGPDKTGTIPPGLLVSGKLDEEAREPSVRIEGPRLVENHPAATELLAHGTYRIKTADLRSPLTIHWTADGLPSSSDSPSFQIGWRRKPGETYHKKYAHRLAVVVTDADDVTRKASRTVFAEFLPLPAKVPPGTIGR